NLVMPGEEEGKGLAEMREKVFKIWLAAPQVTVIGYSFGVHSSLSYDRIWLDAFVEAFRANSTASIHVLSPDATELRDELASRVGRIVNIYEWPLNWFALAVTLLKTAERQGCSSMTELRPHARQVEVLYDRLTRSKSAATLATLLTPGDPEVRLK
ncbi:MAG TPA: hypothetical protein VGU64_13530, partial [Terriglobales bacterium]|nr:hypothetical protein [Terriglobales bacterium]